MSDVLLMTENRFDEIGQPKLTAGANITIENNVISANGGVVYPHITDDDNVKISVKFLFFMGLRVMKFW